MAAPTNAADSRRHLTVAAPPPQDTQGPHNPIPLSPQWLLPKPGDNKPGLLTGDPPLSPHHGIHSNPIKALADGEEFPETERRRDVFRPSARDAARHDHWRDEERETNLIKKDRRRDGEKEQGDSRRIEHWNDNNSSKYIGEGRRAPSDRWNDSTGREKNTDQRRDSKWNSRWGPDDKDSDGWREKWSDQGKDGDGSSDKGVPFSNQVKEPEKESDSSSRPWRPSSLQNRSRGEPSHLQMSTPNKQAQMFGYGRGRGENCTSIFSPSNARTNWNTNMPNANVPPHSVLEKFDAEHRDHHAFKYSRIKLLDIYRMTDLTNNKNKLDVVESLTQTDPVEPLAFSAPSPEELVVIRGIDKGEIVSSGASHTSKDAPIGRNSADNIPRQRGGSAPYIMDDGKDDSNDQIANNAGKDGRVNFEDHSAVREGNMLEKTSPWRSQSVAERSHGLSNEQKDASEMRYRTANMGWHHGQKEQEPELKNSLSVSPHFQNEIHRQPSESFLLEAKTNAKVPNSIVAQQDPFAPSNSEVKRPQHYPAPEDLSLYYKDPQGAIQGPFSGIDLIGWFETGYFGIDLPVRLADAPANVPFAMLGDVMPHLRAKARPPPGFATPKQTDALDVPNRESMVGFGITSSGLGAFESFNHGQKNILGSGTEVENRYLESLMSGRTSRESVSLPEVKHGYVGNSSSSIPAGVGDPANLNFLMAQRMALNQQRSLVSPTPDVHPISQAQNVDLLSILQKAVDKSKTNVVNDGPSGWPDPAAIQPLNNSANVGMDVLQDKSNVHPTQHLTTQTIFGAQHSLSQLNQQPTPHLINHPGDFPSGFAHPEQLLSSGIPQDLQALSLLQQQYLLSQLQLQPQIPVSNQISLLDKMLLLKQQQQEQEQKRFLLQQQEQEQKRFLLQQQQQHLLSNLSGNQSHQQFGDQFRHLLQGALIGENVSAAPQSAVQHPHGGFQIGFQIPIDSVHDLRTSIHPNMPHQVTQNIVQSNVGTPVQHLPHQVFDKLTPSKGLPTATLQAENVQNAGLASTAEVPDTLQCSEVQKAPQDIVVQQLKVHGDQPLEAGSQAREAVKFCPDEMKVVSGDFGGKSSLVKQINDANISSENIGELLSTEPASNKETKTAEGHETKKMSDKKSRKQKNSKGSSKEQQVESTADRVKGTSNEVPKKKVNVHGTQQSETKTESVETNFETKPKLSTAQSVESQKFHDSSSKDIFVEAEICNENVDSRDLSSNLSPSGQVRHPVWKAAPGFKVKSLLEIQKEEQRAMSEKIVSEVPVSVSQTSLPTPQVNVSSWESKPAKEILQGERHSTYATGVTENIDNSKNRNSQFHDLLAAEVLSKSSEVVNTPSTIDNPSLAPPLADTSVADDFIEAKETKKSRKKAAKAKNAGTKAPLPVASSEPSVMTSHAAEKVKSSRAQQEVELAPVTPASPSLGDFVLWKGEQVSSASPSVAWSANSAKAHKPTSLRDILKEQERKLPTPAQPISIPTPPKAQPIQITHVSSSTWQMTGLSPSRVTPPSKSKQLSSAPSKTQNEDDLFWGPLDQAKPDSKQSDFPSLVTINRGTKSTPVKGTPMTTPNKKSAVSRVDTHSPANAGNSSSKGKRGAMSKESEAMDFREWCEGELVRLTGTKDTSFLEFCLKQSTQEADILLRQNLGSFDSDHTFIDKFLNYKEMLSSDVIEIAFQAHMNYSKLPGNAAARVSAAPVSGGNVAEAANEGAKGGSKKKGKKGKKVNPSVLGFNVVSNRIMMGEIQTVED